MEEAGLECCCESKKREEMPTGEGDEAATADAETKAGTEAAMEDNDDDRGDKSEGKND